MSVFALPFLAAALYSSSVILAKLASNTGRMAPTSILFLNNFAIWLVYLPMLFFPDVSVGWPTLWKSIIIGLFFSMGNYATFLCAYKGELSLMTPIMGVKILFVLLFSRLIIGNELPGTMLLSGFICCTAVFLMGYAPKKAGTKPGRERATYALAMWACASYAMCDVLFQKFSEAEDPILLLCICNFIPLVSTIPFIRRFVRDVRYMSVRSLSLGTVSALLMVGEATVLVLAITGGVGAALCNILYNTRSIISIVLVYILGNFYPELNELSRASAIQRIAASVMILAAISMVL